eukprot:356548_1
MLFQTTTRSCIKVMIHMYLVQTITTALHYLNPNIQTNTSTKTMRAITDIPMGTILAIEPPLIDLPHNFTAFAQRFFDSYDSAPFRDLVHSFPMVRMEEGHNFTDPLMNALPAELRDHTIDGHLREFHFVNSIHHLSWNSILYPTLPIFKTGFHANVAIFETHDVLPGVPNDHNCIVIMAASDLTAGETLVKPLDFMQKLMLSPQTWLATFIVDLELWKQKALVHLDDEDRHLLMQHWRDFRLVAAAWTQFKLKDHTNVDLKAVISYQKLLILLYKTGFAPETLVSSGLTEDPVLSDWIFGMHNGKKFTVEYKLGHSILRCIHKGKDGISVFNHPEFMEQFDWKMNRDVAHAVLKDHEFQRWLAKRPQKEAPSKRRRIE